MNFREFKQLLNLPSDQSWIALVPKDRLNMLNRMINYYAPVLKAQFGTYIRKKHHNEIKIKEEADCTQSTNGHSHIVCGQFKHNTHQFCLTSCLKVYENNVTIEIPYYHYMSWENGEYLMAARGNTFIVVDMNKLWKDTYNTKIDHKIMIQSLLPKTRFNSKNMIFNVDELFDQGYVKSFAYYDSRNNTFKGTNQYSIMGTHTLSFKDTFGKNVSVHDTTKLPKNFKQIKLHGALPSYKVQVWRLEPITTDFTKHCQLKSNLKSVWKDFYQTDPTNNKYTSFAKTIKYASDLAKNGMISQRPKTYTGAYGEYVVLSNSVSQRESVEYIKKVLKKRGIE